MLQTELIEYRDQNTVLQGYLAFDNKISGKRPVVLVNHDWSGHNEFARNKAEKLAGLGYVGFALDMFGKGIQGTTTEEKSALIAPFMQNRAALLQRINTALAVVKNIAQVDSKQIAAIGFCFGGLCVLDLARSGAELKGVVSFHGLLHPTNLPSKKIHAKILALHGHDDPMGTPETVLAFEQEMTVAHADWQMHVYGNTKHAFTNPQANDQVLGTVYNSLAEKRSWVAMQNFLSEIFA